MRVLIITTTFPPRPELIHDSIQRYSFQLAKYLTAAGVNVDVVAPGGDLPTGCGDSTELSVSRLRDPTAELGRLGRAMDLHYISFSRSVSAWLDESGSYDVIHTVCQLYAPESIKQHAKALVSTFHHLEEFQRLLDVLHLPVAYWLASWTFRTSDATVCFSDSSRDDLLGFLPRARPNAIHVIPHGVDTARFAPLPELRGPQHDAPCLLFVGSITQRKGVDVLLESSRLLIGEGLRLRVEIIGTGPKKPFYERMARKIGIGDSVTFRERITDGELICAYQSADVFVLPTRKEGFGISLLEAMACGVPVVCTDIEPVGHIVGSGGLVVDSPRPESFADSIRCLLTDQTLRRDVSISARSRAVEGFSWEKSGRLTLGMYEQLTS